jgi:hypothetical protein
MKLTTAMQQQVARIIQDDWLIRRYVAGVAKFSAEKKAAVLAIRTTHQKLFRKMTLECSKIDLRTATVYQIRRTNRGHQTTYIQAYRKSFGQMLNTLRKADLRINKYNALYGQRRYLLKAHYRRIVESMRLRGEMELPADAVCKKQNLTVPLK